MHDWIGIAGLVWAVVHSGISIFKAYKRTGLHGALDQLEIEIEANRHKINLTSAKVANLETKIA